MHLFQADGSCDSCYCTQAGCFKAKMTFDINNCWMGVAIDDTETEMQKLEIAAYNGAMLSNMKSVDVSYVDFFQTVNHQYNFLYSPLIPSAPPLTHDNPTNISSSYLR